MGRSFWKGQKCEKAGGYKMFITAFPRSSFRILRTMGHGRVIWLAQ